MARARVSARRVAASAFQGYRVSSGSSSSSSSSKGTKATNVRRKGGGASRTVNGVKRPF